MFWYRVYQISEISLCNILFYSCNIMSSSYTVLNLFHVVTNVSSNLLNSIQYNFV